MTDSLNPQQQQTAILVADDELTDDQIAAAAGVSRSTLCRWKTSTAFMDAVAAHRTTIANQLERYAIARRARRMAALDDRWQRMKRVIEERAADPEMADIPGGQTGLLLRQQKQIGVGHAAQLVEEYVVDVGLLRELREHEKQAAQEAGQWAEKREVTGRDGAPLFDLDKPITIEYLARDDPSDDAAPDA